MGLFSVVFFFPWQEAYLHPQSSEDFYDEILHSVGFNVSSSVFIEKRCVFAMPTFPSKKWPPALASGMKVIHIWVVATQIFFCFHPYLGKMNPF